MSRLELQNASQSAGGLEIIDERELLCRLPASRRTVFDWRERGLIPCIKLPNSRRVLYCWPDVLAALRRQQSAV
jgi:hypothetical protein